MNIFYLDRDPVKAAKQHYKFITNNHLFISTLVKLCITLNLFIAYKNVTNENLQEL